MADSKLSLERLLTPPAVAKALAVHPQKVRSFIESGELEAFNLAAKRCGRPRYRITPAALNAFLERRKVVPRTVAARRRRDRDAPGFVRYYTDDVCHQGSSEARTAG
jgi:hypothetical protein